jgi:NTP pyrophosphatase (non-canonical NTP hydrolase)
MNQPIASQVTRMNCHHLARHIENLQPEASPQDVARLCLLLVNEYDDLAQLVDRNTLQCAWQETGLRLQLATDQHAAMTKELEDLATSDPKSFTQEQIWVLIRAIKVQSQILQMYVGHPLLDV